METFSEHFCHNVSNHLQVSSPAMKLLRKGTKEWAALEFGLRRAPLRLVVGEYTARLPSTSYVS